MCKSPFTIAGYRFLLHRISPWFTMMLIGRFCYHAQKIKVSLLGPQHPGCKHGVALSYVRKPGKRSQSRLENSSFHIDPFLSSRAFLPAVRFFFTHSATYLPACFCTMLIAAYGINAPLPYHSCRSRNINVYRFLLKWSVKFGTMLFISVAFRNGGLSYSWFLFHSLRVAVEGFFILKRWAASRILPC